MQESSAQRLWLWNRSFYQRLSPPVARVAAGPSCQTSINRPDCQVMSLAERAAKAAKIAQEPELYKVCEGCDSIVTRRVSTCPNCHGYRFEEDPAEVVRQANILGAREKTSVLTEDLQ